MKKITKASMARSLYEAGRDIGQIALAVETTPRYIRRLLEREGLPLDQSGARPGGRFSRRDAGPSKVRPAVFR